MKKRTLRQVQTAKERAERFTRDVLGDSPRAEEIAAESVEDYASRKHLTIQNPEDRRMVTKREKELMAENEEQAILIEQLEEQLDAVRSHVEDALNIFKDDSDEDTEDDSDDQDTDFEDSDAVELAVAR